MYVCQLVFELTAGTPESPFQNFVKGYKAFAA
jgi:hypothetical protein